MPPKNVRLGKQAHKHDDRTLRMAKFIQPTIHVPEKYDFDRDRAKFPMQMFGNDQWGDCVLADRANAQMRLERVETRRTLKIPDQTVVALYERLTGAQTPGDSNDTGLVMLDANRQWRNEGWEVGGHNYTIAAYGELDAGNLSEIKSAIYALHGVHFGFALPAAVEGAPEWDYQGQSGAEWRPGSWGGHCVHGIAYDPEGVTVITWGEKLQVSNAFIERYADEVWAVVDSLDSWKTKSTIDVAALTKQLDQISSRINQ